MNLSYLLIVNFYVQQKQCLLLRIARNIALLKRATIQIHQIASKETRKRWKDTEIHAEKVWGGTIENADSR